MKMKNLFVLKLINIFSIVFGQMWLDASPSSIHYYEFNNQNPIDNQNIYDHLLIIIPQIYFWFSAGILS